MTSWTDEVSKKVSDIIKNAGVRKEGKPSNYGLIIVFFAFNLLLSIIDILSGFSIALLGYQAHKQTVLAAISGLMVIGAGFFPILLAEIMFVRAYASKWQKVIAVFTGIVGFFSTGFYGVVSAALNFMIYTNSLQINSGWGLVVEIVVGVSLVMIMLTHVLLLGTYYFIDDDIRRKQERQSNLAEIEQSVQAINDSKMLANAAKSVVDDLADMSQGEYQAVSAAYKKITGKGIQSEDFGASPNE